jgi:hypothetical protein
VTSLVLNLEGEMSQPGMEFNEQRYKRYQYTFVVSVPNSYRRMTSGTIGTLLWGGGSAWWLVKVPTSRVSSNHGLIYCIDSEAKCIHLKAL